MGEQRKGTLFSAVYNRFLGKITDDMYIELTPEDTIKDLQNILIDAIPFGFDKMFSSSLNKDQIPFAGNFLLNLFDSCEEIFF